MEHFVSETLKYTLTLNAEQVCKCFTGSGPAPYKPDLWALGSPALPPVVTMTLLTSELHGVVPQKHRRSGAVCSTEYFCHVFLEGGGGVFEFKSRLYTKCYVALYCG